MADEVKETEETIKVGKKEYKCLRIDAKGALPKESNGDWTRTVWTTRELGVIGWVQGEATTKTKDFPPTKMSRKILAIGLK